MILYFENADKLINGIEELSKELNFELGSKQDADVCVNITETSEDAVEVNLNGKTASICYGGQIIRFFRGLGLLCEALADGKENFSKREVPKFEKNGAQFDMSRNIVFRPETFKTIMRKMAIMGLNVIELYIEDLYEVPEFPYFGHMRGRYSKEEIRDMDKYASKFGIELLPAIQCLAHLEHALKWEAMYEYRDTISVLLVGDEKVYNLIDKMIASIADCFSTKRLDVCLDEASAMCTGRYRQIYTEQRPVFELFCEHLAKVKEIAEKHGFEELVADSDMFFKMVTGKHYNSDVEFDEEKLKLVPKDVRLNYWRYGIRTSENGEKVYDAEENEKVLKIHKQLTDKVRYLGGIQTWTGPVPLYDLTIKSGIVGLDACIRNDIREVAVTVWNDCDGSPLIFSLYGILNFAEIDYNGHYDEAQLKKRFKFICGIDADDILALEEMNFPKGKKNREVCVMSDYVNYAHSLLFNDPLIGLMDKNIEDTDTRTFYTNLYEELKDRGATEGLFAPAFDYIKAILHILILKGDYGVRLKKAYESRDMAALDVLYEEAIELEKRYNELKRVARELYLYYGKGFGYEVTEMRVCTIASRFETVRYHIDRLREDSSYRIEELEEDRLYLIPDGIPTAVTLMEYRFERFFSANNITKGIIMG